MINPAIEAAARAIAWEIGFEYDLMLASKSEWIDKRGVDDTGQFRDVNDPFRCDIAAAARAAVIAFLRAYVPKYDPAAWPTDGEPREVLKAIADELEASHDA